MIYDVLKDFASPVVTLIAAFTAGFITITFARTQAQIAQSQRDIALDKLKFDLFKRRYATYQSCKTLLEYVPFITDIEKSDPSKLRSLYVSLDESRFYFTPDIYAHLVYIFPRCETFLQHIAQRDQVSTDDREKWSQLADTLARDQSELRQLYASLPERFETALAFRQLTTPQSTK